MAVGKEETFEMKGILANYGPVQVLTNVSVRVEEREIVALLGANGAGKTTTLNTIYGIPTIVRGEVLFCGQSIKGLTPQKLVSFGISYVPEGIKIFAPMKVMDNLILGSYCRLGKAKREDIESDFAYVFELFPVLKEKRKQLAGTLSGGQQQMLGLARGLMSRPKLLLLDEPSLGLAPMLISEVMRVIAELRGEGLSIFLVEQNARAALKIADRGYVMERGIISIEGTAVQLLSDERVRVAYLGEKVRHSIPVPR
jgi:branched-chain amino acid transport system ATP-binding protein